MSISKSNYHEDVFFSFKELNKQKGIRFKHYELIALSFLAKQSLLTSKQFRDILFFFNPSTSETSLNNRIARLKSADIIGVRKANAYVKNDYNKLYIKPYGYRMLVSLEYLSSDWSNMTTARSRGIRNLDHFSSIQELVVSAFIAAYRYGEIIATYNSSYYTEKGMSSIMPDKVILFDDNVFLNIEVDSGSESLSVLEEKAESYLELARSNPDSNFIVMIATIDRSIPLRNVSSFVGEKRISNIKKSLAAKKELVEHSNLDIYVMPIAKSSQWITHLIQHGADYIKGWKENVYEAVVGILNYNNKLFPYRIEERDKELLFPNNLPSTIKSNPFYTLKSTSVHDHKNMILVAMYPGSLRDYYRITYLSDLIESHSLKAYVDRILLIYPSEDDLVKDVFGYTLSNRIHSSAYDMLMNEHITEDTFVYKYLTPFTKERGRFDE